MRARQASVYAFAKSAPTWWNLNGKAIAAPPRLQVWQCYRDAVQAAPNLLDRTMQLSISVVGGNIYLDNGSASTGVEPQLPCQTDSSASLGTLQPGQGRQFTHTMRLIRFAHQQLTD